MSTLKYSLNKFIANVPSCVETTTVAIALEMFRELQCELLVVINERQYPMGFLRSIRFLPQLLGLNQGSIDLNALVSTVLEPMQAISAKITVEEFEVLIRSEQLQVSDNQILALIDSQEKFLGLLDASSLLLARVKNIDDNQKTNPKTDSETKENDKINELPRQSQKIWEGNSFIQLLERLPWPLMLQTADGEVVTQNQAWWQQLGELKDPEAIRQELEEVLLGVKLAREALNTSYFSNIETIGDYKGQIGNEGSNSIHTSVISVTENIFEENNSESALGNRRCVLDAQLGSCTCVVEIENGQERIWQFTKIALDAPEFKYLKASPPYISTPLWLVLATDVTEQQQLTQELASKNADLIQLNRLKDEFLACISHELKTPLTAVLGLSRLLVDQQLGKLNERQARYAGLIHQSGRHLMSVVNDILDLTRMETGQMELTLAPVEINPLVEKAVTEAKIIHAQTVKGEASDKDHEFNLFIEPGLTQIVADELRLRQMLMHLLSNAFKFTQSGGEIGLRVSHWEGWIAFTVWDTGIGIPEHQQHLIFQKFQQLENPLTRQFEGTGLGLVLTRALARLHGGDVSFLSRQGKGSQFTLLLPPNPPSDFRFGVSDLIWENNSAIKNRESLSTSKLKITNRDSPGVFSREKPKAYANSSLEKITSSSFIQNQKPKIQNLQYSRIVLIVEAVGRYIEDLAEQLTTLGYRVVIARSGTEAVEKARRLQPQAILLNPLLPLLSGWDVLTLLKSETSTRHIPVIVTATRAEQQEAFSKRAEGFLSLPIQGTELKSLLEKLQINLEVKQKNETEINCRYRPLKILRLIDPEISFTDTYPTLMQHRVVEVDDLEQAEILARVWQFDVMLLDEEIPSPQNYLQKLSQYPQLLQLPLVTCDVATTHAASKVSGLSVFPCLAPLGKNINLPNKQPEALLSVLQIAAGTCCPPNILVIDLAMLADLPDVNKTKTKTKKSTASPVNSKNSSDNPLGNHRGSEWFQALIQYLQTAGFKAAISRSWVDILQQIGHKNVDLLLICLSKSTMQQEVSSAFSTLAKSTLDLPPILVINRQSGNPSIEKIVNPVTNKILPRSISMEELLRQIHQALGGRD
jgi:signal transduction histidine kinase/CheY-like chemotaxis protein